MSYYHRLYGKYPSPVDSFEDVVNIHMGFPAEEYVTSVFWGTMLEWIVLMDQKELYDNLQSFLADSLGKVTKRAWFLRPDEELKLYDTYAMNHAGDGVVFEPPKTFDELKAYMGFVMEQYTHDVFSYKTYSFDALAFLVCRYYGYLVRVKQ